MPDTYPNRPPKLMPNGTYLMIDSQKIFVIASGIPGRMQGKVKLSGASTVHHAGNGSNGLYEYDDFVVTVAAEDLTKCQFAGQKDISLNIPGKKPLSFPVEYLGHQKSNIEDGKEVLFDVTYTLTCLDAQGAEKAPDYGDFDAPAGVPGA